MRSRPRALDLAGRHRGLVAILAVHAALFAWIVGSASPWATASLECAPGAMADMLVGGSDWSPWDSFHGALGGMFVSVLVGLPLFAAFGVQTWLMKLLAWCAIATVLLIVYALLDRHESRAAALLAVSGLAFCPPPLFHVAAVFGNWHWTQLIFDYGVLLFAVELVRKPRSGWTWGVFGLVTGLGIFNCIASVPFLAVGWGILVVGTLGREVLGRWLAAIAGALVGGSPFLYKLLVHRPFGLVDGPGDQTVGRLQRLSFEPGRVFDLFYPELPWALHLHDVLPGWPAAVTWRLESLWVLVVWVGLGVALVAGVRQVARLRACGEGRRLPVAVAPPLFALAFVAAYVVLDTPLRILPLEFTNVREPAHRMIPPLLAALVVGSGIGWSRMADRVSVRGGRGLVLAVGVVPAALGLISQVALVPRDIPVEIAAVSSYRASCFDALGHFAASSFRGDVDAGLEACAGLRRDDRVERCREGMAWGAGFHGAVLARLPADQAPAGWDESATGFHADAVAICDGLPRERRDGCLFGLGWYAGAGNWGVGDWPIPACDSLAVAADSKTCWQGVGFPIGDHLHPTPWKAAALLGMVPQEHREDVARGMGVAIGRSYGSPEMAEWLCDRIGARDTLACRAGAADWWVSGLDH